MNHLFIIHGNESQIAVMQIWHEFEFIRISMYSMIHLDKNCSIQYREYEPYVQITSLSHLSFLFQYSVLPATSFRNTKLWYWLRSSSGYMSDWYVTQRYQYNLFGFSEGFIPYRIHRQINNHYCHQRPAAGQYIRTTVGRMMRTGKNMLYSETPSGNILSDKGSEAELLQTVANSRQLCEP